MTDCNRLQLAFSRIGRQNLQGIFDGGAITSDGGALLLREVDQAIGLVDSIAAAMDDRRQSGKVTHDLRTLLAQRIYAIAMGYEDGNDHHELRRDPLLQIMAERGIDADQPLASPATLCRFENAVDRQSMARFAEIFVEQFLAAHNTPPKQIVLDFDATDDPVHGRQEGRFFHGYYDHYCYLPLYVFCGRHLLCGYLRPSRIDGAKHSRAILKLLVQRIRRDWPETEIVFRGDSGFCRWKLLRWCDRNDVKYIVGLAKNARLKALARREITTAQWRYRRTRAKQRLFGEFNYAAGSWDAERRIIVKAEHGEQGDNPRFIVTNLDGDGQALYDDVYCQRGEMENRIKEQQLALFADRTSCHAFAANQFRLLLSSAAYTLFEALRRLALAGTGLARAQCDTIRLKLLKIGARITQSVRRIVLHLSSSYPRQHLLAAALDRLRHRQPVPL